MSRRNLQVDELIRKELANIVLRKIEFPYDCLATIINVKSSPDFAKADVFISVTPLENENKILKLLQKSSGYLQHLLNKKLAMRVVPRINFQIKKEESVPEEIDELFRQLEK